MCITYVRMCMIMVFIELCKYIFIITGRTMLHSYYDTLWESFPQDHLITLSRLCNLLTVEERLVETIASYSSSEMANKRILNAALSNVKHDSVLLGFCILVEKLIEDPAKSKVIEKLRNGQYIYLCTIFLCLCVSFKAIIYI